MILIFISVYLLIGYGVHRWIVGLVSNKHRSEFSDADREHFDAVVPLLIIMVLWPKVVFGSLIATIKKRRN